MEFNSLHSDRSCPNLSQINPREKRKRFHIVIFRFMVACHQQPLTSECEKCHRFIAFSHAKCEFGCHSYDFIISISAVVIGSSPSRFTRTHARPKTSISSLFNSPVRHSSFFSLLFGRCCCNICIFGGHSRSACLRCVHSDSPVRLGICRCGNNRELLFLWTFSRFSLLHFDPSTDNSVGSEELCKAVKGVFFYLDLEEE